MAVFTTLIATDFSEPRSSFNAGPSNVLQATSSLLQLVTPDGYYQEYYGSFSYTYSGGYKYLSWPDSTLNSQYSYDSSWNLLVSVTGMSIPGSTYYHYVSNNDVEGLKAYAFQGNDTLNGSGSADVLWGYAGSDVLNGNDGGDTLKGDGGNDTVNGGLGADAMLGGAGDDTYFVENIGDRVIETTATNSTMDAGGVDEVNSAISQDLSAYVGISFVENLTLTGSANINATGNALNNTLLGNDADNILSGKTGADTMLGAAGNDTYYVDNAGDMVYETTTTTSGINAGGTDRVISSVSFSLNATGATFVEHLRLNSANAINGTGNALHNTLYAGAGNNSLDGLGGNDTVSYAFATAGVTIDLRNASTAQATGSSGSDLITNIENLAGSNFNDTLRGNAGANALAGSGGADTLFGYAGNDLLRGGAGNDTLYGGSGQDSFRFDTALSTSAVPNIDQITDFSVVDDRIQLENSIFTVFGTSTTGAINADYFKAISTGGATDSNDYIVYNKTTGAIYYDADGGADGNTDGVHFATIGINLTALGYADFVLV